ncbi:RNA polymerase subunit sigma-70 [Solirubrobacter ginsenosidimutans]|uniref:RNA polymerase sigma factor n=1 Tax=Solirubrobacter ginsenosidimutans TaxID=490573 RepID=A0A9X3MV34_9ACTN|nr:RNA polymerase subunit sigma-70 [Solirubrobacter ginsenosidimutans]MDA0161823.1 RNA polymerase subunit sigma-70 [Solirubrobacter ginsenosidimutans]
MTAPELTTETAFGALTERHRRELQVHCYRMLGSLDEAEDLTQETFLRAWRFRSTYAGRASLRAWLYRIATNVCLDALERRPRMPTDVGEMLWLQPIPDELLSDADEPDAEVVARETIELAFLVAIQHLPPRARAVLILRDVLGWRARDTAELLETSEASVNSALQRARAGLKEHLPARRSEWSADGSAADRALVAKYMEACEAGDAAALKAIMAEDLRFSMPPEGGMYVGGDANVDLWFEGGLGDKENFGELRVALTFANRQPAVANYVKRPGSDVFVPMALDVLTIAGGEITEILAFPLTAFAAFGLPETL